MANILRMGNATGKELNVAATDPLNPTKIYFNDGLDYNEHYFPAQTETRYDQEVGIDFTSQLNGFVNIIIRADYYYMESKGCKVVGSDGSSVGGIYRTSGSGYAITYYVTVPVKKGVNYSFHITGLTNTTSKYSQKPFIRIFRSSKNPELDNDTRIEYVFSSKGAEEIVKFM